MKKTTTAVLVALAAAAGLTPAGAMEISLEENRGQRGSIGFVDLQAVFRRFPEVQRAKQSYAEVVRQAEEQVNLRKAELIRLRADISSLKAEREAAMKAPLFTPPPAPAPQAPVPQAPAPQPPAPPAPAPAAPPEAAAPAAPPANPIASLPGMASTEPLRIAIPGLPEETLAAAPPATPSGAAPVPPVPPAAAPAAAELQADAEERLRLRDAKVKELDAAVAAKTEELAAKQSALGAYQAQVEKDLVDIESKRSELLLGNIYKAVKETAVENGVSVVIDKTAILFGQGSVDLTDKVLKRLEGALP